MSTFRKTSGIVALTALAALGLVGCGDDTDSAATTTPPTTAPAATSTTTPSDGGGGGGLQAGAPSFDSFTVSSPVACEDGNASVEMSFATTNVVSIEIKVGDGSFESTAGYGPNESSVYASIPCSGAGTSSIELRGCTDDDTCANSPKETVEVTG